MVIAAAACPTLETRARRRLRVEPRATERMKTTLGGCSSSVAARRRQDLDAILDIRIRSVHVHANLHAVVALAGTSSSHTAAINGHGLEVPHRPETQRKLDTSIGGGQGKDRGAKCGVLVLRVLLAWARSSPPCLALARARATVRGTPPKLGAVVGAKELTLWIHVDLYHVDVPRTSFEAHRLAGRQLPDLGLVVGARRARGQHLGADLRVCICGE
mmetsp:Transcript_107086/g.341764  ORF Transcript_107086/g.341764 Transcript_107086/m.341764 type:complete len:216 (+) Transcript_107086:1088-1735(+)